MLHSSRGSASPSLPHCTSLRSPAASQCGSAHTPLVQDIEGGTDLTQALTDCGMSVDPAIRELLFENTVLFGGGSALPGLRSRLLLEAAEVASIMVSAPVHAQHSPHHTLAFRTGPPYERH